MNTNNPCDHLRTLFQEVIPMNELDSAVHSLTEEWSPVVGRKVKNILKQRWMFFEIYKHNVFELFAYKYPYMLGNEMVFDNDGRVIIKGDVKCESLSRRDFGYFPALIKKVEGNLTFFENPIEHLDHLQEVSGELYAGHMSSLKSMKSLRKAGELVIRGMGLESLPNLERVKGSLHAKDLQSLRSLGSLTYVGGDLKLSNSGIENLDNLVEVGGHLVLDGAASLASLPLLSSVGGSAVVNGTRVTVIPLLDSVGRSFYGIDIESIPSLTRVNKDLIIGGDELTNLNQLIEVGGDIELESDKLEELLSLRDVGGSFDASSLSNLKRVPKLENIGENLIIGGTKISDLPNLKYVDKKFSARGLEGLVQVPLLREVEVLDLKGTSVTNLPNLEKISTYFSVHESLEAVPKLEDAGIIECFSNDVIIFSQLTTIKGQLKIERIGFRNFQAVFPQLNEVGEVKGCSVFVSNRRLKRQIESLRKAGLINIEGRVVLTRSNPSKRLIENFKGYF
jgi:hypothetical protein